MCCAGIDSLRGTDTYSHRNCQRSGAGCAVARTCYFALLSDAAGGGIGRFNIYQDKKMKNFSILFLFLNLLFLCGCHTVDFGCKMAAVHSSYDSMVRIFHKEYEKETIYNCMLTHKFVYFCTRANPNEIREWSIYNTVFY